METRDLKEVRQMADKKDAQGMLAALRDKIPIPYAQEKYALRGFMKGLEHLENKNPLQSGNSKRGETKNILL